ncbi:hypothetical protein OROGR_026703 [Orobanche gracilis]
MYIDKYSKGRCQKFKDGHSSQMEMLQARLLTLDDNNVHYSKGRCQKFKNGHSSQMEMLQARLLTLDDNNVHVMASIRKGDVKNSTMVIPLKWRCRLLTLDDNNVHRTSNKWNKESKRKTK